MPVARQQIPNMGQWTALKAVLSEQFALMAANTTMDTATEE
jgi:hypothetical protein